MLGSHHQVRDLQPRTKKSFFSADFSVKNKFLVGLETILGRKNRKKSLIFQKNPIFSRKNPIFKPLVALIIYSANFFYILLLFICS